MSGYDFRDACEAGDLDKVKGLIKTVDIDETDEYGYTGLHLAAEHGHLKVVEELMVNIIRLTWGAGTKKYPNNKGKFPNRLETTSKIKKGE